LTFNEGWEGKALLVRMGASEADRASRIGVIKSISIAAALSCRPEFLGGNGVLKIRQYAEL
jgi:hypothetical protein